MAARELKTMALQPGIIYGPVPSRRLGLSLGINLLPPAYKLCSFNCLYCQYGWTSDPTLSPTDQIKDLPQPKEVASALQKSLQQMVKRGAKLDSITFSGNGEPTLHPDLAEIIEAAKELRDQYVPQVKLAILSNSSTVARKSVRETLEMLDLRVMKLDAGSEELIRQLNGPVPPFYLGEIIDGLKRLKDVILQSLFVQGRVTNADPDSVELWLQKVKEIQPRLVQLYTLDRVPAERRLWKVNRATLEWIASQVHWHAAVPAEVY
ncbi:radical SAM protein [bacterium]|nr:MAG: radical SAM protein [bacterium]